MKLIQLFEYAHARDIEDAINLIKADCQEFLSEASAPVFRGSKTLDANTLIQLRKVRADRKPLDTTVSISDAIDNALEPIAGFRPRSQAVFVTGHEDATKAYGKTFLFFPKGDFKFIYSDVIRDFYSDIVLGSNYRLKGDVFAACEQVIKREYGVKNVIDTKLFSKDDIEDFINDKDPYVFFDRLPDEMLPKLVKAIIDRHPEWYNTTDLNSGIRSNNEIMIHCDEYYMISMDALISAGISVNKFMEKLK